MPKRMILVVEDNPTEQQVVTAVARRFGFDAEVAPTAYSALEKLKSQSKSYAVVLMNYVLPVMDGPECAQRIRELESQLQSTRLPIIALTARVQEDSRQECLEAGMDDYLSKPYTLTQFKEMLDRWLPEFAH